MLTFFFNGSASLNKMAAMPIYVKTPKYFLQNQESLRLNLAIQHLGLKVYQVNSNDDTWMTFDLFMARSNVFVAVAILEDCCMGSADMQLLFYSGEQIVAHGPLVLF